MFNPRKLFVILTAIVFLATACVPQEDYDALQTQIAQYPTMTSTPSVQELQTKIAALTIASPAAQLQFTPTQGIAIAASATPTATLAEGAHNPELGSPIVWQEFPFDDVEKLYELVNFHCVGTDAMNGCVVPTVLEFKKGCVINAGRIIECHWADDGTTTWTRVDNVSPIMQDGYMKSGDLRSVCGRTPVEVEEYGQPKDHEWTGIPAHAKDVPVWGLTYRGVEQRYGYGFPHDVTQRGTDCPLLSTEQ